ncbi:MAG TPA: hypothetical protein VLM79_11775 [Kofleriaceae bacterium]|nr:hypothetical protein [Kofleriaceae bacterium]
MSRLRFRSATSLALLAAPGLLAVGCGGDDSCGPGSAPAAGLIASGDAVTLTFGELTAGLNNDCPVSGAPAGVVSMTIFGMQTDGTGGLALCVSRPDLLAGGSQALGPDAAGSEIRVINLQGAAQSCTFKIDPGKAITGTATSKGMCGNGSDPAGFALTLDGALALTRTCGSTVDSVQVTLHGTVAVAANAN